MSIVFFQLGSLFVFFVFDKSLKLQLKLFQSNLFYGFRWQDGFVDVDFRSLFVVRNFGKSETAGIDDALICEYWGIGADGNRYGVDVRESR